MEIQEKSGLLDTAFSLALPLCWFSHSLLKSLHFARPLPIHCTSAAYELHSWTQAPTSSVMQRWQPRQVSPSGGIYPYAKALPIFGQNILPFHLNSFSVHWVLSTLFHRKADTLNISWLTRLLAMFKQRMKWHSEVTPLVTQRRESL